MNTRGSDDGFHEIQLNGKQLVFLFMAATVVSVVIFLCGVLVGRGVRAERGQASEPTISSAPPDPRPQPTAASAGQAAAPSDPTKAQPPPAVDDFSYTALLERPDPAAEKLAPPSPPSERRPATPPTPAPGPETTKSAPAAAPAAAAAPAREVVEAKAKPVKAPADKAGDAAPRGGYVVQVAALNVRAEAEAIATRLSAKGYQAFVMPPTDGSAVYRVRIGRFDSKREADAIATKIKKEERIQPWVTR